MAAALIAGTVAVGLGTAVLNWLNSDEARKASAAERKRMEALLAKIQTPNFKPDDLTTEEYRVVGTFAPEAAPYIQLAKPELVSGETELAQVGLEPRLAALRKLTEVSRTGRDLESDILMQQAAEEAARVGRGLSGSITQGMASRGQLGSGQELAAQLAAQQQGTTRAADSTRVAALEAIRRRNEALAGSAELGGQIRSEAIGLEKSRADVINEFNKLSSARQQDYQNYYADLQNQAALRALQERQRVEDANVAGRNTLQREKMDVSQRNYENEMSKYRAQAGLSDVARSDIQTEARQKAETIGGVGDILQTGIAYGARPEYTPTAPVTPTNNALRRTY